MHDFWGVSSLCKPARQRGWSARSRMGALRKIKSRGACWADIAPGHSPSHHVPPVITDPYFFLLALPAIIVLGLGKGGFAGIGMAAAPPPSLYIPPLPAAATLLA